jgi:hypothetical protein
MIIRRKKIHLNKYPIKSISMIRILMVKTILNTKLPKTSIKEVEEVTKEEQEDTIKSIKSIEVVKDVEEAEVEVVEEVNLISSNTMKNKMWETIRTFLSKEKQKDLMKLRKFKVAINSKPITNRKKLGVKKWGHLCSKNRLEKI